MVEWVKAPSMAAGVAPPYTAMCVQENCDLKKRTLQQFSLLVVEIHPAINRGSSIRKQPRYNP